MLRAKTSSLVVLALIVAGVAAGSVACGSKKPPTTAVTEPSDAGADMPVPPDTTTGDAGPPSEGGTPAIPDPAAPPATLALPTASAKIDMKGKKPAKLELKSDGTLSNGGKAIGKVSGMALQSADGGKTFLTVGSDGAITTSDGTAYGKFDGDDLTTAKGDKLSLADDGTLTWTSGGKATPLGKFDGAGTAKRSAVLAAAYIVAPPPAEKPAAGAKPAGKPKPKK